MATMAVALSTGLYATHTLVPPTPGPIAAAANLRADLGMVVLVGLIIAVVSAAAGYLYAIWIGSKLPLELDEAADDLETIIAKRGALPTPFMSFAPIFLPIILIGLSSLVDFPTVKAAVGASSPLYIGMRFLGHPIIALSLGFVLCLWLTPKLTSGTLFNDWMGTALNDAGTIILITAAGGALGMIIAKTNIGTQLGNMLKVYNLGIFLPFIISAALKTAQGSSTVSLITASTIVYPLLESLGLGTPMGAVLATAAVGCGSMVVSHANDSYFWVVSQFSGLKVTTTYRAHSAATLIQGIVGILAVFIVMKCIV
jgi:GntP family gluconate:H+ symporter